LKALDNRDRAMDLKNKNPPLGSFLEPVFRLSKHGTYQSVRLWVLNAVTATQGILASEDSRKE
jgi:hypothetical protein